jgi:putative transposase
MNDLDWTKKVATFRYGIIADFVGDRKLGWGDKARLLREKTTQTYNIPGSERSTISVATILGWIDVYLKSGRKLESLEPKRRRDKGRYRKIDSTIRMALRDLKAENPEYTVPVMVGKLRTMQLIGPQDQVSKSTIYRFLAQEDLGRAPTDAVDRRRYEAEFANETWQCDLLHGPKLFDGEGKTRKSYLLAIIDDYSRFIIHAKFYDSEGFETLKIALREAIQRRGIPQRFYVDNGACYRSENLQYVTAALGIQLTHSKPYTPQGRGKIERWFKNIREDFFPRLNTSDMSFVEINEQLNTWVYGYNTRVHSVTKMTPEERFRKNLECVRHAPPDLDRYFRKVVIRLVRKDRVVQLDNRIFEVPPTLIDRHVELHFHPEEPEDIEVFFDGRSYGNAIMVDVNLNKRLGREGRQAETQAYEYIQRPAEVQSGSLFEISHDH